MNTKELCKEVRHKVVEKQRSGEGYQKISKSLVILPESPYSIILFTPCTPPHPSPFHRSPRVSVPHCSVLPSPANLVSYSLCYIMFCVKSYMSLDKVQVTFL